MTGDDRFYPRVFGLATAALLAGALFLILRPFLEAILWSMLLALMLFPARQALGRRLGGRWTLTALLLTVTTTIVLVAPLPLLGVAFARQARDLFWLVQKLVAESGISGTGDVLGIPIVSRALRWVETVAPVDAAQIQGWVMSGAQLLLQGLVAVSGSFVLGTLNALVGLSITLFVLFFFLRDGDQMMATAVRLIPITPDRRGQLVDHVAAVTRAVVFGSLLTALVQGALVGIGFALVGLPSPLVFGAVAAVTSLIPYIGTALIWVPAAGVLFLQGRWVAALFLIAWGVVVVSSADNVIRPLFISGRAQIATLPVFLGLIGGLSAFGAIGLVVGPVLVALILTLLRFADEARGGA
ncbi:MAG TPA: AI-2E family transporter [Candidatus Limnocylindria bacterium]|nr:AI-2E family transporter [Candidatus Limnocylindria bacterium]